MVLVMMVVMMMVLIMVIMWVIVVVHDDNNCNDYSAETDFRLGGVDKYLGGGAAACFGRGVVATPVKAKGKV
jgi:hypothetical protein